MKTFAKNILKFLRLYLYALWIGLLNLPRLILGMALFFLPIYILGNATFFILPKNELFSLFSSISAILAGLYILEETRYGDFVKRIFPF
ncbi:MAG: hypothetical protein A2481_02400 [Candidatus Yonathbacteria bacterium RIFOXYC2_FULL_47_9]|nr:MAG: hypothetical protein A2481_02400 [Candidatus Yonathbacteria bacterium RIFOXYC2_FULL_47_9]HAT68549.1 hypothetical protein [Candidatus Yonathbacteria bacterium]